MTRKRVLALMEAYSLGGPAKNLVRFAKLVNESRPDFEISVATFYRGSQGQADVPANDFILAVRQAGIPIVVINESCRFDWRILSRLSGILHERSPDIVQTHGVKSHFIMSLIQLRQHYRWIAFHHGLTAEDIKMRVYNQLNRWSLPRATRVVTVCHAFRKSLAESGVASDLIDVLPNAIDSPPLSIKSTASQITSPSEKNAGEHIILSIGRLSREKAHRDLIQSTAHLLRTEPDLNIRVIIVGDGPERARLERLSIRSGLERQISFVGYRRVVDQFWGIADVFVLPSHSEGCPNVLLEAMAAGVPIVATAVGGIPDMVVGDQSALLVPRAAPLELAAAIVRLLRDRALANRLSARAQATIGSSFSAGVYSERLLSIYQKLLNSPSVMR